MKEDLLLTTELNESSPLNIKKEKTENKSPLFFNKSPTLDNYLLPTEDNLNKSNIIKNLQLDECSLNTSLTDKSNFNIEEALTNLNQTKDLNNDSLDNNTDNLYSDDNLLLVDPNFRNRNNFAIFILINKLNKAYNNSTSGFSYMITPLKKNFDLFEKQIVQIDLDEIKEGEYKNFIYFPFNTKLIDIINDNN